MQLDELPDAAQPHKNSLLLQYAKTIQVTGHRRTAGRLAKKGLPTATTASGVTRRRFRQRYSVHYESVPIAKCSSPVSASAIEQALLGPAANVVHDEWHFGLPANSQPPYLRGQAAADASFSRP